MGKIGYTNKVALNENPEVADINKVKAGDMNEIKSVVNANDDLRGDLSTLTTTSKTSVVNAINELNSNKALKTDLGTIANLTTTDKTSAVAAINELNTNKASNDIVVVSSSDPTGNNWKLYIDSGEDADNAYYNDNGTKTSLKTTTYDTLPVGAEVDFIGDTVPSGWTQVSDYSTTEIDTGKLWIDGKKIYRISFEFTKTANDQRIMTISNLDVVINAQTYLKRSDLSGQFKNINNFYADTTDRFTLYVQNNEIRCSSPYMGTLYGTLEYTKSS